jgi:hypothetical protein
MDFPTEDLSSDDEYFPTIEELEDIDDDDEIETDEEEERIEDEEWREAMEEEDEGEEGEEIDIERVLLQVHPDILQRVLQHGLSHGLASDPDLNGEAPRRTRRGRQVDTLRPPFQTGQKLLSSGEFGAIDDRVAKKRRFEGARTITHLARYRELGYKRENSVFLTKKWLPHEKKGRVVARYNRHVYSGQFSHDGSFFYTASQDFKCRMYSTPNPANPKDWKLYKVTYFLMASLTRDCES